MRKSASYDPMAQPPTATPTGEGSGGGNPTTPAVSHDRLDNTNAGRLGSLADVFANLHRPLPGERGGSDGR